MCRGALQYFGLCGHEKKFHPTALCSSYSPDLDKCLGTLTICHQTVIHSPGICVACAVRIETSMKRECELGTREFEQKISTLNHTLGEEKDTRIHRAIASERTDMIKAMVDFIEERDTELADFQKEKGRNAPGRAEDLPHDWWNDDNDADLDLALESPRNLRDDDNDKEEEEKDPPRIAGSLPRQRRIC